MTSQTILVLVLSAAIGAAPFVVALIRGRVNRIPAVAKVKEDYPVISIVLSQLAQSTDDATILGLVADAAYLLWSERDVSADVARQMSAAAVAHFSKPRYENTIFEQLDPAAIQKGRQIAGIIQNQASPIGGSIGNVAN